MKSLTELFGIVTVAKPFIITGPTDEEIKIMNEKDLKEKEYEDNLKRLDNIRKNKERELMISHRNAREKVDADARDKRYKDRKLHLKELTDIKTEFDLIFISFLDRTTCVSSCDNTGNNAHSKDKIVYTIALKYPVTSDISTMVKTISEINEDMLDIEAYTKYINSKSINRISTVKLEGNTNYYSLNVEITTTTKSIYTDESYYTRNSIDYDDWMMIDNSWMSGYSSECFNRQGVGRVDRRGSSMERFYDNRGWIRR